MHSWASTMFSCTSSQSRSASFHHCLVNQGSLAMIIARLPTVKYSHIKATWPWQSAVEIPAFPLVFIRASMIRDFLHFSWSKFPLPSPNGLEVQKLRDATIQPKIVHKINHWNFSHQKCWKSIKTLVFTFIPSINHYTYDISTNEVKDQIVDSIIHCCKICKQIKSMKIMFPFEKRTELQLKLKSWMLELEYGEP